MSKLNDEGVIVKINVHRTIKSLYTLQLIGDGKLTAAAPGFLQSLDENMRPYDN